MYFLNEEWDIVFLCSIESVFQHFGRNALGKVSSLLFLGFSRIKFFVLFGSANGVNISLKDPGSCELKYLCIKIFELTSSISLNLRILSLPNN